MVELPSLRLEAVQACVPANVVDNLELCTALVGAAKATAIVTSTGFPFRRVLEPGRTVSDLMLPAARAALEGVDPASVGGVVVVSFSSPARFPALAARLQRALALPGDIAALDLQLACAGYPYGLMVAGQLAAATGRRVLLVDGDMQSAHVDPSDVNTLAVMSDAASATLVSATDGAPARFAFLTDGSGGEVLACGADGRIRMDGFGVFRFVAGTVTAFLGDFLKALPAPPDLFVPHQANMYMVRQMARTLGLGDRLLTSGERFANPGSGSVPLTLAANGGEGRTLLAGFGAGLAASAADILLPPDCRRGVCEA